MYYDVVKKNQPVVLISSLNIAYSSAKVKEHTTNIGQCYYDLSILICNSLLNTSIN